MGKKKQEKKKSSRSLTEDFLILVEEGLRTAGRITKREYDRVTEAVRERLQRKYGKEKVDEFYSRLKGNWQDMMARMEELRERMEGEEAVKKGKKIAADVLQTLSRSLKRAAENLEATFSDKVTFHSGQIVEKGVFLCNGCSKIQEVKRRRKLSPCLECGGSEFRMA